MNERGEQLKTFTKFGSCVTSDCFNFMDINQLYPSYTHTGIPISNILDEANINILEEDIIADNFFWKKMPRFLPETRQTKFYSTVNSLG